MQKTSTDEGKRTFHLLPGQDFGCFSHCLRSPRKIQGGTTNDQGWKMSLFPLPQWSLLDLQNAYSRFTNSDKRKIKCAQLTQKIKLKKNNIYFMHFVQPATAMVPTRPVAPNQCAVPGHSLLPGWFERLCCKLLPYNQEWKPRRRTAHRQRQQPAPHHRQPRSSSPPQVWRGMSFLC